MTTSGTVTSFNPNRTALIRAAALDVGAVAANVEMQATQAADFNFILNAMVAEWSVRGIKVWTVKEAVLFPVSEQSLYTIGHGTDTENDHCCDARTMVAATLAADVAAAATSFTLEDATGITDGWQIGVMLESGDFHWSTVNGTPVGDVVTVDDALPSTAVDGDRVFCYPANIDKPIRITEARRIDINTLRRTPFIRMYARKDFMELPDPVTSGTPYAPWYDRQIAAGYLNLLPPPVSPLTDLVGFTWHRGIEDFANASDTADLPKEWVNCLRWNLASEFLARYPNAARKDTIMSKAAASLEAMAGVDREEESVFFGPEPYSGNPGPWSQWDNR